MVKTFSIPLLAERCQAETERYRQTRQSDPTYCFELFRRALTQQLEAAWQAIEAQYRVLVSRWVYEYTAEVDEDPAVFVNEAFARMWQYGGKSETVVKLDNLGKCLSYLKKCVWSAVEEHRLRQKRALMVMELKNLDQLAAKGESLERQLIETDLRQAVRQALEETVQNEQERRVAEETWFYDRKPRQIQADYPELFGSVEEVSQIKHNLLKRLKRNQMLKQRFE